MPGKDTVRAGALLLLLVACSKPAEVSAAGSGNSTPPAKESGPAPTAPARAAEPAPTPAGEAVEAQVLIWGGGRTPEEGRKALERFEAERAGLEAILSPGKGYPQVVASDTLPGLKPGFHVVMLGACKPEETKQPLEILQAFKPGVYARPVKMALGPESCPKAENGLRWIGSDSLKVKPLELSAAAFRSRDRDTSPVPWLVRLYLRDEKGELVDQMTVDPRDGMWDGTDRTTCLPLTEVAGTDMRVIVKCEALPGGPWDKEHAPELTYRITNGKIEWVSSPH